MDNEICLFQIYLRLYAIINKINLQNKSDIIIISGY